MAPREPSALYISMEKSPPRPWRMQMIPSAPMPKWRSDNRLEELEKDALILDVLGQHVADHYVKGKRKEWDEYQTRVSSWELEKYLVIY